jgi:hypothetical protein
MCRNSPLSIRVLLFGGMAILLAGAAVDAGDPLVSVGEVWHYFKGTEEPSDPISAWLRPEFDDSTWLTGPTGIGFGDGDDATDLLDMVGNYLSVYMRKSFTVVDPRRLGEVTFRMDYDDGFVAYLNGVEIARKGLTGNPPAYNEKSTSHEAGGVESFPVATTLLEAGANVLTVQVHNIALSSTDLTAAPVLECTGGVTIARLGYSTPSVLSRKAETTLRLTGTSTFDLAAFSAVVLYDAGLLQCTGTSFLGTVWNDADFRSVDDTIAGVVRIGVVEDTTRSGNFVSRGEDQSFVDIQLQAGSCLGSATVGFGETPGMNIFVDVSAVGHDVIGSDLQSTTIAITAGSTFVRGNANNSPINFTNAVDAAPASVTLSDAVFILYDLFGDGPPPPCRDAADANDSGSYDITDSITIMQYLFNNSQDTVIAPPFLTFGEDTGESLGCETPPSAVSCP